MPQEIYLDHAAATPTDRRVVLAMNRAMRLSGNPSSFNDAGRKAAAALESARAGVAKFLHARAGEIVFCSSGSEANTLALAGAKHILTQPTEHLSVLRAAGKRAKYITVDEFGFVNPDDIIRALDLRTQIVSVMYANNEIGTIQPIVRIGRAIAQWRRAHHSAYPLFHVDACQATTYLDMDVQRLGVDLLTLNGAKHTDHGAAVLFVRRGAAVCRLCWAVRRRADGVQELKMFRLGWLGNRACAGEEIRKYDSGTIAGPADSGCSCCRSGCTCQRTTWLRAAGKQCEHLYSRNGQREPFA